MLKPVLRIYPTLPPSLALLVLETQRNKLDNIEKGIKPLKATVVAFRDNLSFRVKWCYFYEHCPTVLQKLHDLLSLAKPRVGPDSHMLPTETSTTPAQESLSVSVVCCCLI